MACPQRQTTEAGLEAGLEFVRCLEPSAGERLVQTSSGLWCQALAVARQIVDLALVRFVLRALELDLEHADLAVFIQPRADLEPGRATFDVVQEAAQVRGLEIGGPVGEHPAAVDVEHLAVIAQPLGQLLEAVAGDHVLVVDPPQQRCPLVEFP